MQWKNPLDALPLDDAADGERRAHAFPAPGDDHAAEDLDALFCAFEDALVHIDLIADAELGDFFFARSILDQGYQSVLHDYLPSFLSDKSLLEESPGSR